MGGRACFHARLENEACVTIEPQQSFSELSALFACRSIPKECLSLSLSLSLSTSSVNLVGELGLKTQKPRREEKKKKRKKEWQFFLFIERYVNFVASISREIALNLRRCTRPLGV